jgi:hypothetical protein
MGKSLILGGLVRTAGLIACAKEAVFQALEQQKGQMIQRFRRMCLKRAELGRD